MSWPPTGLGEPGWRTRLECLATRAEALIGRHCRLADTAGMALELVGLLWPVLGAPETVAATCRASLLVGAPGVVAANPACDQLAEVHERLDEIWHQAQGNPSAGVVELPTPLLVEIKPVPAELADPVEPEPEALVELEPEPAVEPEPEPAVEPEPEDDELPPAWQTEPPPIELEPVWLRSDDLAAELGISRTTALVMARKGLFDGLSRKPHPGEGKGRRFSLEACREVYQRNPVRSRTKPPAPLPVVVEDLPPAVEPSAPAPTPEPAADAAALLELVGGDAGTLAALRELLLVPGG